MASIIARHLVLDFPVFRDSDFSLKRAALRMLGQKSDAPPLFRSIDGLNLRVEHGERIGLYGPNGSGKSTLLRLLASIYYPTAGTLEIEGKVTAILGLGAGTNPELSAEANIHMLLRVEGITPTAELVDTIWRFTEIDDTFRTMPLKAFSSGMQMRVLFSLSTFYKADILALDEWLSVVDENFQQKAEQRMLDLAESSNILVLASHSLGVLRRVCTRIIYLQHGQVLKDEIVTREVKASARAEMLAAHAEAGK